ncbi:hypothetical protein PAMP_018073 [Pampus punctatissimus]
MSEETRVIYHLEDQDTPYLIRINVPAQRVTLLDFKQVLNKPNLKFFFKSVDDDFGSDLLFGSLLFIKSKLINESYEDEDDDDDDSCQPDFKAADIQSVATPTSLATPTIERTGVIGDSRPPSFHAAADGCQDELQGSEVSLSPRENREETLQRKDVSDQGGRPNGHAHQPVDQKRYSFLGISIVGQSNDRGDGGIYIGSIMKGGAVAADGRIEPGDMLLQVNDINFENMSNDDAVRVLREIVHKPGPVTLTVAKCWDPNPRGCFTLPRSEPVRPIDPAAWVSHTAAMTGRLLPHYGVHEDKQLTIHSDMTAVVKAMANPELGLEVRDRMWLKITIPNAFIGSDVVDWLHRNVEGFTDRREARKYAGNLLKAGYIRHTVSKVTFSEQCYYVFGDLCGDLGMMSLLDHDGASSRGETSGHDPLAPASGPPWPPAFPYQYPIPHPYSSPHPLPQLPTWVGGGGSQHSEGSCSSGSNCGDDQMEGRGGGDSQSEPTEHPGDDSAGRLLSSSSGLHGNKDCPSPPPGQVCDVSSIPPEDSASRQSFRLAIGNPGDFFVDVM